MRPIPSSVAAILVATVAIAGAGDDERFSEQAQAEADSRRAKITAEIGTLATHAWAGDYYYGDGTGTNVSLLLAPDAGYLFEWHGCMGLYGRNYGAVTESRVGTPLVTLDAGSIRLQLAFAFENESKGFGGIAPEWIVVNWGPRRYLIAADDVVGFCSAINMGSEPRNGMWGSFLLRQGDEAKPAEGWPMLPANYREYLLARPVESSVVAVGKPSLRPSIVDWMFKDTPLTLGAGTNQGLRVGMELVVIEPKDLVQTVLITAVEADRAEALMTQMGEDEPGPHIGWRLSTQAPWHASKQR